MKSRQVILFDAWNTGNFVETIGLTDFPGGVRSGVNGTPTFFINGHRHDGPFELDDLVEAIARHITQESAARGCRNTHEEEASMSIGLQIFTSVHVIISLIGIAAGFMVIYGFLTAKRFDRWNAVFLAFTILTSVTGFMFPIERFTPGHAVGILSLIALSIAVAARYPKQMAGRWGATYVVTAVISQYFNFAVLIIQSFQKVPPLHDLAPTQAEPPFLVTQLVTLALFIGLAIGGVRRFRAEPVHQPDLRANVAAHS